MKGYTHTCASCDAVFKIPDRYVGRTLHCPSCGTEFLADPTLADIDDIIDELVPERRRSVPWLTIVLAVVVLGVLALVFGQADPHGFFAELFKAKRTPGQFAALELAGLDRVPTAMDHETVVVVVNALEDGDAGSIDMLRAQGRIIDLAPRVKVKVIERVRRDRAARVRVVEGVWTGRVLWVPEVALN